MLGNKKNVQLNLKQLFCGYEANCFFSMLTIIQGIIVTDMRIEGKTKTDLTKKK